MSDAPLAATPQEQYLQENQGRLEQEYGEEVAEQAEDDLDTDDGIPEDSTESEAEGDSPLEAAESEEDETDTEEGTPDEEDSEDGSYETRYKELQASFTEATQSLSKLKSEYAERAGEITDARITLTKETEQVEQAAKFWSDMAQRDLQQLQQVNVHQLSQEQYAQWQQQSNQAQHKANQMHQALENTQAQAKRAREDAVSREASIARARLDLVIDNFAEVYPEIGSYAASRGVNPAVFRDITDPGLIELIHESMKNQAQPDAIKEVKTKTTAKKRTAKNLRARDESGRYKKADQRFKTATTVADRRQAYLDREQGRLNREYSR